MKVAFKRKQVLPYITTEHDSKKKEIILLQLPPSIIRRFSRYPCITTTLEFPIHMICILDQIEQHHLHIIQKQTRACCFEMSFYGFPQMCIFRTINIHTTVTIYAYFHINMQFVLFWP